MKRREPLQQLSWAEEEMCDMTEIELKNVSYIYGKDTPFERIALHNVSMTFRGGMITV